MMIHSFKEILSDLEHFPETENEYVSENDLYEFIVEKLDYKGLDESISFYFKKIAAAAIAKELIKQTGYEVPSFSTDLVFELLLDKDEEIYLNLYKYYIDDISFLKVHQINGQYCFIGENLRIKHDALLNMFALIIAKELSIELENVNKILLDKVKLGEWDYYIFAGSGDIPEGKPKELLESVVYGVLK
jgi:hypothetical protein